VQVNKIGILLKCYLKGESIRGRIKFTSTKVRLTLIWGAINNGVICEWTETKDKGSGKMYLVKGGGNGMSHLLRGEAENIKWWKM